MMVPEFLRNLRDQDAKYDNFFNGASKKNTGCVRETGTLGCVVSNILFVSGIGRLLGHSGYITNAGDAVIVLRG